MLLSLPSYAIYYYYFGTHAEDLWSLLSHYYVLNK